jgi:[histone H3]-lysine9 N-trimethyltransferase SUV39H
MLWLQAVIAFPQPPAVSLESITLSELAHPLTVPSDTSLTFRDDQFPGLSVVQFTPARTMLEFAPKVYYSRDIPHSVQDLMNTMDAHYRRSTMAKEMFEAIIYENTYEDEPNAPRISIINDVDGDLEVTPAWEFHYSNRIWHSDDVPPPDFANLRGCDCEGFCDPKSQTCSCLRRQQEYSEDIPGFIYDDKGRLKQRGFPIFECSDLCGCLEGCRNRVCPCLILRDLDT